MNLDLGFISAKYESGNLGIAAISNIPGDPGGKSYGKFQLSKTSLIDYINKSVFQFSNLFTGTKEFDLQWLLICKLFPTEFELEQNMYITKTHFLPASIFAKDIGFNTKSRRIQESVFSIAVQHGGAKKIILNALSYDEADDIERLYIARADYVRGLSLSEKLKDTLINRYQLELEDVQRMAE